MAKFAKTCMEKNPTKRFESQSEDISTIGGNKG